MSYENKLNEALGFGGGGVHLGFGGGGVQPTGSVLKSVENRFFDVIILVVYE
jgi:hypothetical protein